MRTSIGEQLNVREEVLSSQSIANNGMQNFQIE